MSCGKCSFINGELEDTCRQCGEPLLESSAPRKLKAVGSHPEAPNRKSSGSKGTEAAEVKVPSDTEGVDDVDDVKTMFKMMMRQSEKMVNMMTTVQDEVKSSKQQTAAVIDEFKKDVKEDIERLDNNIDNLTNQHEETRANLVALRSEFDQIKSTAGTKGDGKGTGKTGKDVQRMGERKRTVVFSNFPNDTQADDIIKMINDKVQTARTNVEDVYAYAKSGTEGAARFKTEDTMWEFLVANKGNHCHYFGGQRIYMKAGGRVPKEEEIKDKAVRKVVRALIEHANGDGETIKKRIDAKYPWGAVWWQLESGQWQKVAQWNATDQKMKLMGHALPLQAAFDKLME